MRTRTLPAKKTLPAFAAVAALAAVLTGCGTSEADTGSSAGGEVTIRIPDPGNAGVLAVGKKDGSLAKALSAAHAKVAWTGSSGPFFPAAQAINADQLDIAVSSITAGVTALGQKPGFKFFTATAPDLAGEGVLVKDGSGINSVQDLVGKKVAVSQGGTGEYLLLKALAKNNIPADKVKRVYLKPDQTAAVFNSGQVDAWAVWSTYAVAEIANSKAHFVADGTAIGSDNYSLYAVRTGFADLHPEVVKALYQYLHDASVKEKADPEAYLNVTTDAGPTAVSGKAKEVQIGFIKQQGTVDPIKQSDIARFETVAQFYYDQKVTRTKVDVKPHLLDIGTLK
jgi:sulfonate transport system substrate-binding protein